jgi:hypothetical protein
MTLDKQFHGDREGTSQGEMLTAGTRIKANRHLRGHRAGHRNPESPQGKLRLQHSRAMTPGHVQMVVRVVPDSGCDQLVGLAGTMTIKIDKVNMTTPNTRWLKRPEMQAVSWTHAMPVEKNEDP